METFSALLALCVGNSPVSGDFPAHRPVTRSFDVFIDLRLDKHLSKQTWGWWFETLPRPLWRHSNAKFMMGIPVTIRRLLSEYRPRIYPDQNQDPQLPYRHKRYFKVVIPKGGQLESAFFNSLPTQKYYQINIYFFTGPNVWSLHINETQFINSLIFVTTY